MGQLKKSRGIQTLLLLAIATAISACAKPRTEAKELAGSVSEELRIESFTRLESKPVELQWRTTRREALRFDLETCIPTAGQCIPDVRIECSSAAAEACRIYAMRSEIEGDGSEVGPEISSENAVLTISNSGDGAVYHFYRPNSNLLNVETQIVRIRASRTLPQGGVEEGPWAEEDR